MTIEIGQNLAMLLMVVAAAAHCVHNIMQSSNHRIKSQHRPYSATEERVEAQYRRKTNIMGLDIYVRWDGMTDEEQNAQYTGYRDSCETGYLRFNWTGVKVCRCIANKTGAPNPIRHLYPEWNGSNGEVIFVDDDVMRRLADVRTQLAEWLRSGIPQEIRLDDFPDENPVGLRQWFVGKVHAAMVLINFVELNKDKPNLRIEFS